MVILKVYGHMFTLVIQIQIIKQLDLLNIPVKTHKVFHLM